MFGTVKEEKRALNKRDEGAEGVKRRCADGSDGK